MSALVGMDRVALSQVTFPDATFAQHASLAASVGAAGLGVWGVQLAEVGVDRARGLLDEHGLRVANAVPLANSVFPYELAPTPSDPRAREGQLAAQLPDLARLGAESVVVLTGPRPKGTTAAAALATCRDVLGRLARQAEDVGLRLAVEPIHPSVAAPFSLVTSFTDAVALAAAVDGPLGIVVDTWHVHGEPDLAASLRAHADLVAGVQAADHRPDARGWADRACPGEGTGTREVLADLLAAGWQGLVDIELFSDDGRFESPVDGSLWQLPPPELARRATALFRD